MPYLLLIVFPVVMAVSTFLLRKQTGLVVGAAIATALVQLLLIAPLPIDQPTRFLGVTLTFNALNKLFLLTFPVLAALALLATLRLPHGENFVPVALLILGLTSSTLLLQDPFIITLLLVGAGITVVLALVDLPPEASVLVDQRTLIAALKYLVLMVIAGVLTYLAFVLADIYEPGALPGRLSLAKLILALLAVAFAIRLAVIPFHAWLPDLVEMAAPMVTVFTVALINATSLLVLIGTFQLFPVLLTENPVGTRVLMVVGVASCVLGGLMALVAPNPRRMLGYLFAADSGVALFGLTSTTVVGLSGAILGIFNQALAALLLLVSLALLEQPDGRGGGQVRRDLLRRWPLASICFVCGGLALLGVPPFSGFVARLLVYQAALERGWGYLALLLLGTVLGLLALLRFAQARLLGPSDDAPIEVGQLLGATELDRPPRRRLAPEARIPASVALLVLAASLLIGLYPQPLLNNIDRVIQGLNFIKAL
jgi:formate hydrogenlyase subunit 3/multisubunit Na+/H+ antiporter MnhD subunit